MVDSSASIRVTDTVHEEHCTCTVEDLFTRYVSYLRNDEIDFNNKCVYVGTGTGYTKLLEIKRSEINSPWIRLKLNQRIIDISGDTLIPIYDEFAIVGYRGFHGEIKMDPKEIMATDIHKNDGFLMMYDMENHTPVFVNICELLLIENPIELFGKYGYKFRTESGFIDINNVYIYAK